MGRDLEGFNPLIMVEIITILGVLIALGNLVLRTAEFVLKLRDRNAK